MMMIQFSFLFCLENFVFSFHNFYLIDFRTFFFFFDWILRFGNLNIVIHIQVEIEIIICRHPVNKENHSKFEIQPDDRIEEKFYGKEIFPKKKFLFVLNNNFLLFFIFIFVFHWQTLIFSNDKHIF